MSSVGTTRSQLIWWFAIVAGASYFVAVRADLKGVDLTASKGLGVGMLALWAARHADTIDGLAIAAVLTCGAAGDVLLETHGLIVGAIAFLLGHAVATWLYARDRWGAGWPVVAVASLAVSAAGFALTHAPGVAVYAAGLGAMAGAASLSRFGWLVVVGAGLFVVSDLLIFARNGPLAGSASPDWLIWPTYFAGQALIAYGVVIGQAEEVTQ